MQHRSTEVDILAHGIPGLAWTDGFQAKVSLSNYAQPGGRLTHLANRTVFDTARPEDDGCVVAWSICGGTDIAISSDGLREDAVLQAAHPTAAE